MCDGFYESLHVVWILLSLPRGSASGRRLVDVQIACGTAIPQHKISRESACYRMEVVEVSEDTMCALLFSRVVTVIAATLPLNRPHFSVTAGGLSRGRVIIVHL